MTHFLSSLGVILGNIFNHLNDANLAKEPIKAECSTMSTSTSQNETRIKFKEDLAKVLSSQKKIEYTAAEEMITYWTEMDIILTNKTSERKTATWSLDNQIKINPGITLDVDKRFFRIGVVSDVEPWEWQIKDPDSNKMKWVGYCIDLAKKLSEVMNFDYVFQEPKVGTYGEKIKGTNEWDGLVGDLARGETDIVIAPLTMTSEREEVIDFVAPYFDQSGISIMIRKPERPTSLFKFMTVLRTEVWISIVVALTMTGFLVWILDRLSPYSYKNNKENYPYPCRDFTLKESFWFALTSFTPQGGGEAPKALSGRVLVAAYWLFVVLMLATFTANLAAFLTVERMKTPVESLDQLSRQSRINYTVIEHGDAHQFFINMRTAEEKLYGVWKDLTLNASSDQVEYRVWDYPIKEQYGHILLAMEQTGFLKSEEEGIEKVLASKDGEFAFIHDSASVKYRVYQNCNLTEVGEVFAERPYAIAVQQGSQLQEEISRRILDLQKDRYFETQSAVYWNQTAASYCPTESDSEGITLESLGGVFIATIFGLILAMLTLAAEIYYYRNKEEVDLKLQKFGLGKKKKKKQKPEDIRKDKSSESFPAKVVGNKGPRNLMEDFEYLKRSDGKVSYISVFPKNTNTYN